MYQKTSHTIELNNEGGVPLPVQWFLRDTSRRRGLTRTGTRQGLLSANGTANGTGPVGLPSSLSDADGRLRSANLLPDSRIGMLSIHLVSASFLRLLVTILPWLSTIPSFLISISSQYTAILYINTCLLFPVFVFTF